MNGAARLPSNPRMLPAPPTLPRFRPGRRCALAFITATLTLQVLAGFKLLSPPRQLEPLQPLRLVPAPALWPFLDYNMYARAWPEGRTIEQPRLVARLADGTRHVITPEDAGLLFRELRDDYVNPLRGGQIAVAPALARRLREQGGLDPVAIAVEVTPLIVHRDGVREGAVQELRVVVIAPASADR